MDVFTPELAPRAPQLLARVAGYINRRLAEGDSMREITQLVLGYDKIDDYLWARIAFKAMEGTEYTAIILESEDIKRQLQQRNFNPMRQ